MAKILVVDDDADTRESLSDWLAREHEVRLAGSVPEAIAMMSVVVPDVVISDFELPPHRGDRFLEELSETHPEVVRIMHTGSPARALGSAYTVAHRVLKKGCDMRLLSDAIHELVRRRPRANETG